MNRVVSDSSASARKKPTPTGSWTPLTKVSCGISMTSSDMWQPYILTPSSMARSRSCGRVETLLAPIILPNIQRPIPPKEKCEGFAFSMPPPYIMPSIFPNRVLPVILASARLIARRPQKVKNIVTSLPIAAAPVAMMNAPKSLSMSPLITALDSFRFFGSPATGAATGIVATAVSDMAVLLRLRARTAPGASRPSPRRAACFPLLLVLAQRCVDELLAAVERFRHDLADEVEGLDDLWVGERVAHVGALAGTEDHALGAQDREVLGEVRLGDVRPLLKLGDGQPAVAQGVYDALALLAGQRLAYVRVQAVEVLFVRHRQLAAEYASAVS